MPLGEVKRVIKCAVPFKIKRIKHSTHSMNTIFLFIWIYFFIINKFYKLQENRKESHIDTHDFLFSSFARNFVKTRRFFVKSRARFKRNIGLVTKWLQNCSKIKREKFSTCFTSTLLYYYVHKQVLRNYNSNTLSFFFLLYIKDAYRVEKFTYRVARFECSRVDESGQASSFIGRLGSHRWFSANERQKFLSWLQ